MDTYSSEYFYKERIGKNDEVIQFALTLAKALIKKKLRVSLNISLTSNSVYLLLNGGALGVVRLSDHTAKNYKTKYNVVLGVEKYSYNKGRPIFPLILNNDSYKIVVKNILKDLDRFKMGTLDEYKCNTSRSKSSYKSIRQSSEDGVFRMVLSNNIKLKI